MIASRTWRVYASPNRTIVVPDPFESAEQFPTKPTDFTWMLQPALKKMTAIILTVLIAGVFLLWRFPEGPLEIPTFIAVLCAGMILFWPGIFLPLLLTRMGYGYCGVVFRVNHKAALKAANPAGNQQHAETTP